jgi:hypothetical protein
MHSAILASANRKGIQMTDEFGLNKDAMLNNPRSLNPWDSWIVLERDGNSICAHLNKFDNLQESPAGFGDTPLEAIKNLLIDRKLTCRHPMWFGNGVPAGHCGEAAYMGAVHPNTISGILHPELARCPRHGSFDLDAAAALVLYYRTPNRVEFIDEGD